MKKASGLIEKSYNKLKTAGFILLFFIIFPSFLAAQEKPVIIAGPYLQHVTQTSIVIMWETDIPCTSTLKYGKARFHKDKSNAPLDRQLTSDKLNTIHELVLEIWFRNQIIFIRFIHITRRGRKLIQRSLLFKRQY